MDEHRTLDDAPPTAADAWQIIERAQARVGCLLTPSAAVFYAIWGVEWLVVGTVSWASAYGWVGPDPLVGIALSVLLLVGVAASITVGVRRGRGVRREHAVRGRLYASSWVISMVGLSFLLWGLHRAGLPDAALAVLYPGAYVFLAGALYLATGALWRDVPQYVLGVWTIVVGIATVHAGFPAGNLVMALGGGGGLLVTAAYLQRKRTR